MNRAQLEHLIRASGDIADDDHIVVVGSQSILGAHPDAPRSLRVSMEADVYPRTHPNRADIIDGAIGEFSAFHDAFGYYAQGVGPETAICAPGWEGRLVPVVNSNTRGVTGWCLEPHDLVLAKLAAGREKDFSFATEALRNRIVRPSVLARRLDDLPVEESVRQRLRAWLA